MPKKTIPKPAEFDYQLDRVFHEKARLGIMTCLMSQPEGLSFSDLKEQCGLSDGNLNRHLEVLSESGFLDTEKSGAGRGSKTNYRLSPCGRKAFDNYLEELERVLAIAQKAAIRHEKTILSPGRARNGLLQR